MRMRIWSTMGIVLLLAACGSPKPELPTPDEQSQPDISGIEITGDASNPVNKLAMVAIADLEKFWGEHYPDMYGSEYQPLEGGFFAVMPSSGEPPPPCSADAAEVSGNAYYCPSEDVIAWDAEDLLPGLKDKFGDFTIPVVLAHEYGHAIQARSNFTARTVTRELQADCFAGAWSRHAQDDGVFEVSSGDLDDALAGILTVRDTPGKLKFESDAHGSGFDRVGAFQDGYENGLARCKDYRDDEPYVLELPFLNAEDEARGGDAPYDTIVNGVPYDLEDYWTQLYPFLTDGQPWPPVAGLQPFSPDNSPMCGDESTEGSALFYCATDDFVAWDNVDAMPEIYRQGGDYAVATMLATQYGRAALARLGDESDSKTITLRADCFAGGYTANVINRDRSDTSSYQISPGDLDEGISALLLFRGENTGFARVRAFREGVINGAVACPEYQG